MNLWTHSERKWALEPESKPDFEGIHLILKIVQLSELNSFNFTDSGSWTLTISLYMDKVLNFIKINESLDSFGTEMSSRTRIKTRSIEGIHLHHKDKSN